MLLLSHTFNLSPESSSDIVLPSRRIKSAWMWQHVVFGVVGLSALLSMFKFSTLTHLQTGPTHLPLAMLSTNGRSVDVTSSRFSMLNSPHWSGQFPSWPEAWESMPMCFTSTYIVASLLAEKSGGAYNIVSTWIRYKLSFALLCASVVCLLGRLGPKHQHYAPQSRHLLQSWRRIFSQGVVTKSCMSMAKIWPSWR